MTEVEEADMSEIYRLMVQPILGDHGKSDTAMISSVGTSHPLIPQPPKGEPFLPLRHTLDSVERGRVHVMRNEADRRTLQEP